MEGHLDSNDVLLCLLLLLVCFEIKSPVSQGSFKLAG